MQIPSPPVPGDLHSKPASPARPHEFIVNALEPFLLLFFMLAHGIPGAIRDQIVSFNPILWLNPFEWHRRILANGFPVVLNEANRLFQNFKRPLIQSAYGQVLEVGAGSGVNLEYYRPEQLETLYCLEPLAPLCEQLEKAIQNANLSDKAVIIPAGIQDQTLLTQNGIVSESIDTIVLVQVLCSIPNPKSHLDYLQSLLKPGGQLLVFEHVGSKHRVARKMQNVYTPFWGYIMAGCQLNRDSTDWLREIGGWERIDIQRPVKENTSVLFPHAVARFVKAK